MKLVQILTSENQRMSCVCVYECVSVFPVCGCSVIMCVFARNPLIIVCIAIKSLRVCVCMCVAVYVQRVSSVRVCVCVGQQCQV